MNNFHHVLMLRFYVGVHCLVPFCARKIVMPIKVIDAQNMLNVILVDQLIHENKH